MVHSAIPGPRGGIMAVSGGIRRYQPTLRVHGQEDIHSPSAAGINNQENSEIAASIIVDYGMPINTVRESS